MLRIGELAARAELNVQARRYYERRGLLGPARRTESRYRDYDAEALRRVRFIRRAQNLGFTLEEIHNLLGLWADSARSCSAVAGGARATLERIEGKIADLRQMSDGLAKVRRGLREAQHSPGDVRSSKNSEPCRRSR